MRGPTVAYPAAARKGRSSPSRAHNRPALGWQGRGGGAGGMCALDVGSAVTPVTAPFAPIWHSDAIAAERRATVLVDAFLAGDGEALRAAGDPALSTALKPQELADLRAALFLRGQALVGAARIKARKSARQLMNSTQTMLAPHEGQSTPGIDRQV